MHYRLVILVMCSTYTPFKKLERSIKETWGSVFHPDVRIIFYSDNQRIFFKKKSPVLKGNDLILPCDDGYLNCTEKTLQALTYIANNFQFDYVFRTNLGSFVYQERALNFLNNKPVNKFYSGIPGVHDNQDRKISFASGSGFFLSRDLVDMIVSRREQVKSELIDDVAFGEFLLNNGINIDDRAIRLSYTNAGTLLQIGDRTVDTVDKDLIYHVRLRSDDRIYDIRRMHELFNGHYKGLK